MKLFKVRKKPIALGLVAMMAVSLIPTSSISAKTKYKTKTEDGKEYIIFGSYEQDGNTKNGKEPIEWEILGEDKNGMLVVSRYILDWKPYNEKETSVTWETCTLRKWLNKEFYSTAFNAKEQKMINTAKVKNPDNEYDGTEGGKNTKDKVFCLSVEEILKYYNFNIYFDEVEFGHYGYCQDLIIIPTRYAVNNGLQTFDITESDFDTYRDNYGYSKECLNRGSGRWWLRSPGCNDQEACRVCNDGEAGPSPRCSVPVDMDDVGVRPALYLKKSNAATASSDAAKPKYKTKTEDGKEYIVFGSYEQDGNAKNGKEPIEWEVLGEDDKGILVVSRYIIDRLPYNEGQTYVTWKTCTLRKWLNKKFYDTAFDAEEQKMINTVKVKNSDNVYMGAEGGKNTKDKIFCLSIDEILKYYDFSLFYDKDHIDENGKYDYGYCQELIITPTRYAQNKGVEPNDLTEADYEACRDYYGYTEYCLNRGGGSWWLRTPSSNNEFACWVSYEGCTGASCVGGYGVKDSRGIRPAMYLKK